MEVPAAGLPGGLYVPRNYDGKFHGPVRMRRSLANSFNIPALKALGMAGISPTIDMAHRLGINGLQAGAERYGLSLTLGGGEATLLDMTTVYASLANLGRRVRPNAILKITDAGALAGGGALRSSLGFALPTSSPTCSPTMPPARRPSTPATRSMWASRRRPRRAPPMTTATTGPWATRRIWPWASGPAIRTTAP